MDSDSSYDDEPLDELISLNENSTFAAWSNSLTENVLGSSHQKAMKKIDGIGMEVNFLNTLFT